MKKKKKKKNDERKKEKKTGEKGAKRKRKEKESITKTLESLALVSYIGKRQVGFPHDAISSETKY